MKTCEGIQTVVNGPVKLVRLVTGKDQHKPEDQNNDKIIRKYTPKVNNQVKVPQTCMLDDHILIKAS